MKTCRNNKRPRKQGRRTRSKRQKGCGNILSFRRNLIRAIRDEDTEELKRLLDEGADVNRKYKDGWTALMQASAIGSPEMVTMLLDKGADVNAKNDGGWTALIWASVNGHK